MLRTCKFLVILKPFLVGSFHLISSTLLYAENSWMPFSVCGKFYFLVDFKVFKVLE